MKICGDNIDESMISINFGMKDTSDIESLLEIKNMCDDLEIKSIIYKNTHKNRGACTRNDQQIELECIATHLED